MSTTLHDNLSGAYALNAVTADEAAAHESLMALNEALRTETIELTDTAVRLGLAVGELRPPQRVRYELMELLAVTPQYAAADSGSAAGAVTADSVATSALSGVAHVAPRRRRRRTAVISALAAGVLLAGAAVAVVVSTSVSPLSQISAASDAQHQTAVAQNGARLSVVWSADQGRAVATVAGASALNADQTYQFWYIADGTARSAGTMNADGWTTLQGHPAPGEELAVTVEPRGGSTQPTSTPIASLALT